MDSDSDKPTIEIGQTEGHELDPSVPTVAPKGSLAHIDQLERLRERLDTALEDLAECKRRLAKYDELFDVDMLRALKAFKNQNSPRKWRAETRMEKA